MSEAREEDSGWFKFPPEVRNMIGSEFFLWPPDWPHECVSKRAPALWTTRPLAVSMLRLSKRVYAEAAGILYGENTLYICRSPNSIKNLLQTIGPRNAGLIRRVAVGWDYFHFPTTADDDPEEYDSEQFYMGFHWPYASFPSPLSLLAEEDGGGHFAGLTELEFREFTHLKFEGSGRAPLWWNSSMHISLRFDKMYVDQSRREGSDWTKQVAEALPALLETRLRAAFPRLRGVTLEHVAWPS
ncbi:hypothetical protein PG984_002323 [Apiospora sp. TS-2023a]